MRKIILINISCFTWGDIMKLKLNKIKEELVLCDYDVYQEIISKEDNYTMYKIARNSSSNPMGILYNCMIYLENGRITPQEILINSETNIIEKVTLFVSKNINYKISFANYLITEKMFECNIELNECTIDWKGRFLKIVKESSLMWGEKDNLMYFIFSDAPKKMNAYYVSKNCRILVDDCGNIQGFSIR